MAQLTRREFIRELIRGGVVLAGAKIFLPLAGCSPKRSATPSLTTPVIAPTPTPSLTPTPSPSVPVATVSPAPPGTPHLVVARGSSPKVMTEQVIKALGGIERFVKKGNDVIVKPNICVAYHTYEYGATTNPEVAGTLVRLCLGAGAKRVRVMDQPFGGTPQQAYEKSGIAAAVRQAGGEMEIMSAVKYRETPIPEGKDIKKWSVYGDVLDADVLINVPVAKHHSLARLTLGMKNLMGIVQNRNQFHLNLGQRIPDLVSLVRPTLTVVDCVRIMMQHGPSGGSLDDVKMANTVIASPDIVAADSYAATLFGLTGNAIPAIRAGAEMGLGTMDLKSIRVEEISL